MAGRVRQRAVKVPGATFHCVSPGPPSGCPFPRPRPIQILAVKLVLIHQHPHGTTADANPVLLASVAGFPQWLWETDPPPLPWLPDHCSLLPRSSHHSRLFRGQRTESLCLHSQAGPRMASGQADQCRPGNRRAGWSRTRMPAQAAWKSRPCFLGHVS